jgi:hypothetical protein
MVTNTTPKLALWLLRVCAAPHYRDALIGDVIELRKAGRSYAWCWRQALFAVAARLIGAIRGKPWFAAVKAMILALGMISFGAGTLVWAESVTADTSAHQSPLGHR